MKIFVDEKGFEIPFGVPFERDGVAYPANWLAVAGEEDLKARGVRVVEKPDLVESEGRFIPTGITRRQARLVLLSAGLLAQVEDYIRLGGKELQINWEDATVFERNNPFLLELAKELKLTDDQVDAMFQLASTL